MAIKIKTRKKREVIDITESINAWLKNEKVSQGICNIFLTHTSSAITTADLDPGSDRDYLDAFSTLVPKLDFRHPHDPTHMGDHILSVLIGTSLAIPFSGAKLLLGTWQRVILIEFNGPRERKLIITAVN